MRKIPKLRFPEFEGEWEKAKLNDKCEINPQNGNLPNSFIYIDLESVNNGILLKENVLLKSESPSRAQRFLKRKDILFQMVRPYQKNNLFFDKKGDYVASTGYAQVRTKQSPYFIYQYLHSHRFVNEVIEKCTGTSYPSINTKDLASINIFIPSINEQEKIAGFLSLIDERINGLTKIIEGLKSFKTSMSKKIFSQKFRFKDDNGNSFTDWSVSKLGVILIKNSTKNKDQKYLLVQSVSNKYGFINQEKYFEDRRIASKDTSNYYVIKKGYFAYNPSRIDVGSLAYKSDIEVSIISPLYISFKADNDVLIDYFLLNWFSSKEFIKQMSNSFEGSVRNTLSYENLIKMSISLPCIDEQNKIADFLSSIDNKIQLETSYLEQLRKQKQYLLQQMFI